MITKLLPGYENQAVLHYGTSCLIVRAVECATDESVIIKSLHDRRASTEAIAALHHEYGILSRIDAPGVPRARTLLYTEGRPHLVMDDLGGISLRTMMDAGPASEQLFFDVARALVNTLQHLQYAHVVHKNINPSHIIVHPETHVTQLIDFSIASVLPKETQKLVNPRVLEGALPYISPEQTGRMNRSIDARTDFYSLGITLYELFAGRLPFVAQNPLEWVHCHIAKTPIDLQEASPRCPRALAMVVMKMFAKNAEDRYQSAKGLLHDVETCQAIGDDDVENAKFVTGRHDHTAQFSLPQHLYGRQPQIDKLLEVFGTVAEGATSLMLVGGYSGIGKTSLIAEIHKPIVRHHGYFISGKFDQFKRDIPYSSLIHAFRELVQQLMTENEAALETWRHRLATALGANAEVITDVIPDVEKIIGEPPKVQALGANEAQSRFHEVFQDFVRVFASAEHPLAIFLDDLQWADSASLKLLYSLCTDPKSSHVFLIGAYRDNEVDAAHLLTRTIRELQAAGARVDSIHLEPLGQADVEHFVADTLHTDTTSVLELARLIHERTLGNPFFVSQCLRELHTAELLNFDPATGAWLWDLDRITGVGIPDNVVELMTGKIARLAEATQSALTLAACIGNRFDVETLAVVARRTSRETAANLWPALRDGLIVPLNDACRTLQRGNGVITDIEISATISCAFLHDRVQQAAYSLISEADKKKVHLEVGRRMLSQIDTWGEDWRFDVINHLNVGAELIVDPAERLEVAELNLRSGMKAMGSTAYGSAAGYLAAGIRLLPSEPWVKAYRQTFELHKALSECAYLLGDFERAEALFDLVLAHAQGRRHKGDIYNIRIAFYSSVGRFIDAINAGFEGLELYGIEMRSAGSDLGGAIERELASIEEQLAGRQLSDLAALPVMTDAAVEDCMFLLMNLTTQTYIADQDWFPLVSMKMVSLSLKYGNALVSAFGYGYLGVVLGTLRGEYKRGQELSDLSLALNAKLKQPKLDCKLFWISGALINHWTRHIRTDIPLLRSSVQVGIDSGDRVFGSWAYYYLVVSTLLSGEILGKTLEEANEALAFFRKTKNRTYEDLQMIVRNVVLNLQGAITERRSLSDDSFSEERCILDMRARSHGPGLGRYHVLKMMVLCIHEFYEEACAMGEASEKTLRYLTAQPLLAEHFFYHAISLCRRCDDVDAQQRQSYRERASSCLERLRVWAQSCPENFLHKAQLIEAELARVDGRLALAPELYEAAIESARDHGFIHNEAMAHSLAGTFLMSRNLATAAKAHLQCARDLYAAWGAKSRVQDLEAKYPAIGQMSARDTLGAVGGMGSAVRLDAMTLVKATRAISGELRIGSLFETIMAIMVESVGAQVGYLFHEEGKDLVLTAESNSGLVREPGLARGAERVINYVRRTGKVVVLKDASRDPTFREDPHIASRGIKSLLCMPMRHKGAVVGILYFENALLAGAFTAAQVEMLEIQAAQATVSLENARLYGELEGANAALEQLVAQRTAELTAIFDNAAEAIVTFNANGAIERANPATAQLFDYQLDKLLERRVTDLLPQIDWNQSLSTKRRTEVTGYQRDGKAVTLEMTLNQMDIHGRVVFNCMLHDITARKKTERLKNEFISTVSHELRTPLTSISGSLGLIVGGVVGDISEDVRELVNIAKDNVGRLTLLVNDILDIDKLESGTLDTVCSTQDLRPVVRQALVQIRGYADGYGITIVLDETQIPDQAILVYADASRLLQVMANLLSNAIKFSPPGDKVEVSVEVVESRVRIAVRDHGPGVPDDFRDRIFQKFAQADGGDTRARGGSGLGLSISKAIVERFGGTIGFDVAPEGGSTFYFVLPLSTPVD